MPQSRITATLAVTGSTSAKAPVFGYPLPGFSGYGTGSGSGKLTVWPSSLMSS